MKQLIFCLFLLFFLNVYSHAAIPTDVSPEKLVHQINVTDSYRWSPEHSKYVLLNTQLDFKTMVQQAEPSVRANVVDEGIVSDISKNSKRYLSVHTNTVYFESEASDKVVIDAKLSDDKKKLLVYFSEKRKTDLLKGMLAVVNVGLTQTDSYKTQFSDYECTVQNSKLVCSINYVLKKNLNPEITESNSARL